ncbi:MAG: nitrate reductase molybdenum cofactor assembly chaperone [Sphingomonadales bacterium]|nr:nitrate reductase molybdenum cofactor assembly chaperone [Sphingomonadales bacterium]
MAKTFKALSLLLSYPTAEVQAAAGDIAEAIDSEGLIQEPLSRGVQDFARELASGDLYDFQERYVLLFDRTRSLSLHLFEHVHGEGRDRGQALVDLKALYEQNGLVIGTSELPDFLPLFLEFLSILPEAEARDLLGQPAHILNALKDRLRQRDSSYAVLLEALLSLANTDNAQAGDLIEVGDDNPHDLAALDRQWQEEAVTFGPPIEDAGCPRMADIVKTLKPSEIVGQGREG